MHKSLLLVLLQTYVEKNNNIFYLNINKKVLLVYGLLHEKDNVAIMKLQAHFYLLHFFSNFKTCIFINKRLILSYLSSDRGICLKICI